jgi:putative membrane protein
MEVKFGRLAEKHATDQSVKDFAKRMVYDHSKANKELESVAKNKGVSLDTKLDQSQKDEMDRMSKLNGTDFDKAYMDMMVKDHEEDVNEFKKASNDLSDPDLKNFATTTLPTLEEHLKMAKDVKSNLNK